MRYAIFSFIYLEHAKGMDLPALYCGPRKPMNEDKFVHAYTRTLATCFLIHCFEIS